MMAQQRWRCPQHGIVEPAPPDEDGLVRCATCKALLVLQQPDHPELGGPDYLVARGTGTGVDGQWLDRQVQLAGGAFVTTDPTGQLLRMVPAGEFEIREEDGAVAEVWRPEGSPG
jgi:hypothetical protein